MKKRIALGAAAIGAALVAFTAPAAQAGVSIQGPFDNQATCSVAAALWAGGHPGGAVSSCRKSADGRWYFTAVD